MSRGENTNCSLWERASKCGGAVARNPNPNSSFFLSTSLRRHLHQHQSQLNRYTQTSLVFGFFFHSFTNVISSNLKQRPLADRHQPQIEARGRLVSYSDSVVDFLTNERLYTVDIFSSPIVGGSGSRLCMHSILQPSLATSQKFLIFNPRTTSSGCFSVPA